MGQKSAIEWTGGTWTPIRARVKADAAAIAEQKGWPSLVKIITGGKVNMTGHVGPHCEVISPGCEHCYSDTNNSRCLPNNGTGLPFDRRSRELVDIFLDEKILEQPLHWKAPRNIFVCSQTDLFGDWVPDELIDRVVMMMGVCKQHTFQVLTKRAERMRKYFANSETPFGELPNLHLGVSVEDQKRADERIPLLLQTPAAVRWISAEPLLGAINLHRFFPCPGSAGLGIGEVGPACACMGCSFNYGDGRGINWVVVGGESGPGARPLDESWVRSLVQQCKAASVPAFVKQMGAVPMESEEVWRGRVRTRLLKASNRDRVPDGFVPLHYSDKKGGDIAEFPPDLQVREYPEGAR